MQNLSKVLFKSSIIIFISYSFLFSQQRNPVLEYCTGTWCQWCPCGHTIVEQIESSLPNAIFLGYHGPSGSSDPWDEFPGNSIISLLTFAAYPTGIVDRTSSPASRDTWFGTMNNRNSVPATVSISINGTFNSGNRLLNLNINTTALQNLTGTFKMNLIIVEDSLVYPQTGNTSCPGGSQYVHNNVVKAMINGAEGDVLVNGSTWNSGETLSKNIQYTVPANFNADKCDLVVLVYKTQSPFYVSQIQQAEEYELTNLSQISISVTSPNGGENILGGSNYDITWLALNTDSVKIEYSSDSGVAWIPIVNSFLNTGIFNWDVPETTTNTCKIRVSNTASPANYDVSDNSFTVYPFQFNVYNGWNLVSVPILSEDMSKSSIFQTAVSAAYGYNNAYLIIDTLINGDGYWVKFDSNETINMYGNFVSQTTVNIVNGWNIIGPFDETVDVNSITTQPPDILTSAFYGYGIGYFIANELEPGLGYWIKASADGIILLNTNK